MEPGSPDEIDKPVVKPKPCLRLRLQKALSGHSLRSSSSGTPSPTTSPNKFNYDRNSLDNVFTKKSWSLDESRSSTPGTPENDGKSPSTTMTSPAIKAANQPKENGKSESSSDSNIRVESEVRPTPPLTAWWRVFKLANLLMQQGC